MLIVLGNPRLDALLHQIQILEFVDTPESLYVSALYLVRVANALLNNDNPLATSIYNSEIVDELDDIVYEFVKALGFDTAEISLFDQSSNPYDYFLILEITDGCSR